MPPSLVQLSRPIPTVQCCLLTTSCLGLYLLSSAAFFHPAVSLPIPTVRCCVLSSSCLGLYRLSSAAFSRPVLPSRPVVSAYTYCPVPPSLVQLSRPLLHPAYTYCPVRPSLIQLSRSIPTVQCCLLSSSCLGLYLLFSAAFPRPVLPSLVQCCLLSSSCPDPCYVWLIPTVQCCLLSSSAAFSRPAVPTLVTSGLDLLSSAAFSRPVVLTYAYCPVLPSLAQLSRSLLSM